MKKIHALDIVHGDVRPANILAVEDGNEVWNIDFEHSQIIAEGDEGSRRFQIKWRQFTACCESYLT